MTINLCTLKNTISTTTSILTSVSCMSWCWWILTIHEDIKGIIIHFIDIISWNVNVINSYADWNRSYCYGRIIYFSNPELHPIVIVWEIIMIYDLNSNWITSNLWFNQSAFNSISSRSPSYHITIPIIKGATNNLSSLCISFQITCKKSISIRINCRKFNVYSRI